MQSFLILHLQAPLMSFGGPQVDQIGPTGSFPTLSQLTGMIANALGYRHGDFERLQSLQDRLSVGSALINEGEEIEDYQTVDLGQRHLRFPAWTTRGNAEHRAGGPDARYGTHIRYRRYRASACVVTAVSLSRPEEAPTLSNLESALTAPARPLFIGRKSCIPSTRIVLGIIEKAASPKDAISNVPETFPEAWSAILSGKVGDDIVCEWPLVDESAFQSGEYYHMYRVTDQRDWRNRLHGGERVVVQERLSLVESELVEAK